MFKKISNLFSKKSNDANVVEKVEPKANPSGSMTLQDFMNQMNMMSKMGSLSKVMKYIPGVPKEALDPAVIKKAEAELAVFKKIVEAMTEGERLDPKILDRSSKQRVAETAGVTVGDIDRLLTRFEQTQQYAKLYKDNKGFPKF